MSKYKVGDVLFEQPDITSSKIFVLQRLGYWIHSRGKTFQYLIRSEYKYDDEVHVRFDVWNEDHLDKCYKAVDILELTKERLDTMQKEMKATEEYINEQV